MPKYVDGFVLVIKEKDVDAYKKMATLGGKIWKKHGALDYKECVSDDIRSKGMGMTPFFPKMLNLKRGELVVFSYIVFKSRKHRDEVNAKVMQDPAMDPKNFEGKTMPFDMQRMAYGGFKVLVDTKA